MEADPIYFYYLKEKLVKYLYWSFTHGKNRLCISKNLDIFISLACEKTWRFGI